MDKTSESDPVTGMAHGIVDFAPCSISYGLSQTNYICSKLIVTESLQVSDISGFQTIYKDVSYNLI